jgi:CxxC motif-containing protein
MARFDQADTVQVTGNACPRGQAWAMEEIRDPRRTLTTSLATAFPGQPRLAVRIDDVPQPRVRQAMDAIDGILVTESVAAGAIVVENFLGIGLRIVALQGLR